MFDYNAVGNRSAAASCILKNNKYLIITVAEHTETGEKFVVYKALYGECKDYIRPVDMFMSEVDHEKYPDVKQKYRFERINRNI